ncbi:hypothetical protein HNP29_005613 [Pseudomonas alcaligenes]|nr:hypothetical protein [Pseudomonas alcaligenes]
METNILVEEIKENIKYQEKKLNFLWGAREKTNQIFLNQAAREEEPDAENATMNQTFTDALLNSLASLIDYYYIFCFLKMGINEENITKIQYRPINNKALLSSSKFREKSVTQIKARVDSDFSSLAKLKASDFPHEYWTVFHSEAIASILFNSGIKPEIIPQNFYTPSGLKIDSLIHKYHNHMQFFYCNRYFDHGVKYNIFLDINNCLKHNIVPYVRPSFENYDGEERAYAYIKIENKNSIFLKSGILKSLIEFDFDLMHDSLAQIHNNTNIENKLEAYLEMNGILRIDMINGYLSKDQETLYFFIDNILMAKTKNAIYIDSYKSLKKTLSCLIGDIRLGMNLDLSEFDLPASK